MINKPKTNVQCYHGKGNGGLSDGDYVVVIFTDDDTRSNIARIKNNEDTIEMPINHKRHDLNYGIIIGTINI